MRAVIWPMLATPKEQPPRNLSGTRIADGRAFWKVGAVTGVSPDTPPHRRGKLDNADARSWETAFRSHSQVP